MTSEMEEILLEKEHHMRIANTFSNYEILIRNKLEKHYRDYKNLPQNHQNLIKSFKEHLCKISELTKKNQKFFSLVIRDHQYDNDKINKNNDRNNNDNTFLSSNHNYNDKDLDFLSCSLRQLVRDWSEEGSHERLQSYGPILNLLQSHFSEESKRSSFQVLVPGAGLGRLAYEIARLGTMISLKIIICF